jgi:preprotein translocase subunit SecG
MITSPFVDTLLNVLFVLIAIAMIVLILLQRGAGAQAGSGFGSGASATVFGARGSANFLSQSTKYLAIAFFALTLFMAWESGQRAKAGPAKVDLGVMSTLPAAAPATPSAATGTAPSASAPAPSATPATPVIAPAPGATPAAPVKQDAAPAPVEGSKGG